MEEQTPKFLVEILKNQYGEKITSNIIEGYQKQRATTFRVNTLKSNVKEVEKELENANIQYKKSELGKEIFIVKTADKTRLKQMEIYETGKIYMQSLSSMLPPIILEPKQGEDILDMAAAPGGKTTQMACITENKANITACEMNKIRAERLKFNVEKQGANAYIMLKDARFLDDFFSFDKILLDAPCSGSGTINVNDKNLQKYFTEKLIEKCSKTQLQLLIKAIKLLKPGKEMVYSTCSILSKENEEIVEKAVKLFGKAEIVPIKWEKEKYLPKLPTKIPGTICVCPTELFEGFFIAKIKKL